MSLCCFLSLHQNHPRHRSRVLSFSATRLPLGVCSPDRFLLSDSVRYVEVASIAEIGINHNLFEIFFVFRIPDRSMVWLLLFLYFRSTPSEVVDSRVLCLRYCVTRLDPIVDVPELRGANDVAVQFCTHYVMHFVIRYVLVRRDMHLGVLAVRIWEETPMTLLQSQIQQELSKHEPGCCSSGTSYAGTKLPLCSIPLAYEVEEHVENSNVPALHAP
ncbi:uncharacterized protein BO95DRAFT_16950 [Aspergillus brunneoviolaceus CBS 621.78]|uniref:Uncharacterized protein n=1 Tax=Aspergillus brunneoviolaceus CBS 621.78 TaxID=1450534 RepID=A0ACD1FU38_9EURO|nr:hypothetical protein BO95DRAFT_16950 [Aspergillus brunneoviolaceus CBS 621.78]RAH40425.1 hypothetical protein BO95DRAFT_16950 [Aspergillus brunneoviolaceus CBS 621.78]